MEKLKVGDVVCLKSDMALKMTINAIGNDNNDAQCVWFNGFELRYGSFALDALIKSDK